MVRSAKDSSNCVNLDSLSACRLAISHFKKAAEPVSMTSRKVGLADRVGGGNLVPGVREVSRAWVLRTLTF